MTHTIRYRKDVIDPWHYMALFGTEPEMVKRAKGVGVAELGKPAYYAVQVVRLENLPVVWSSRETVSPAGLE